MKKFAIICVLFAGCGEREQEVYVGNNPTRLLPQSQSRIVITNNMLVRGQLSTDQVSAALKEVSKIPDLELRVTIIEKTTNAVNVWLPGYVAIYSLSNHRLESVGKIRIEGPF